MKTKMIFVFLFALILSSCCIQKDLQFEYSDFDRYAEFELQAVFSEYHTNSPAFGETNTIFILYNIDSTKYVKFIRNKKEFKKTFFPEIIDIKITEILYPGDSAYSTTISYRGFDMSTNSKYILIIEYFKYKNYIGNVYLSDENSDNYNYIYYKLIPNPIIR
jgi:hypothetical protein